METDPIIAEFIAIEAEIREHLKYRQAHPLFVANTRKARPEPKQVDRAKKHRYLKKKRADADNCTRCITAKATKGRLCAGCHEKEVERQRVRNALRPTTRKERAA